MIAQDYAREGRIVGFPGDWVKNVPHPRLAATRETFADVLRKADAALVASADLSSEASGILNEAFESARYAAQVGVYVRRNSP